MTEVKPFWKFPGPDRRSSERRADRGRSDAPAADRRRDDRRASRGDRRRFVRHQVPFGPHSPRGSLRTVGGSDLPVTLWDLSEGGVCVVSRRAPVDPPGTPMALELHASLGVQQVQLNLLLVWTATDDGLFGSFTGLRFPDGKHLPRGSFLDLYLKPG